MIVETAGSSGFANPAADLSMQLNRHAFYVGEEIPVEIVCTNTGSDPLEDIHLEASIDGLIEQQNEIASLEEKESIPCLLRMPSSGLRAGRYKIIIALHSPQGRVATCEAEISLARRPTGDRMPVWMWPHKAFLDQLKPFDDRSKRTLDWWASHGFTDVAVGEGISDGVLDGLDYALTLGLNVCLMPHGGLEATPSFGEQGEEVWFKGPGDQKLYGIAGKYRILNPFHPKVIAWHDRENEQLMRRVASYPQIRSAFFNSEVVDQLRVNLNVQGKQRMEEALGFGPEELGEHDFVKPGVVADDDRRLKFHRYVYKKGNGLAAANQRTADMLHRYRPDLLTINDPFRSWALLDGFPGIDVIGSWTYTNPDPKLMLYVETLRAACRNTDQIPLSTVTLLNYPGELTPSEKDWTMMGPGRLAVTTWINLSRAPRILGYYFSSACDPFNALEDDLTTPKKDISEEALPPSTYEMMQRLAEEVFQPLGGVIRQCEVEPRRIAVLNSDTSALIRDRKPLLGHYPNIQIQHFYTVLAMAQLPADIVFEEEIERYGLGGYDVLVLPQCDVLPKSVYDKVMDFHDRGGLIIADQYLGPEIPNVVKFAFDFSYRKHVTAIAIAKGRGYADWNDQLQPNTARMEVVKGVSALEDQKIMESYAAKLRATLGNRIERAVDCSEPTALVSLLDAKGCQYLVVVNDKRDYDERVGKYRAVLGKITPQTVTVTLHHWDDKELVAYDLITHQELKVEKLDGYYRFDVALTEVGGTLIALCPRSVESLDVTVPTTVVRGAKTHVSVRLLDANGHTPLGIQPIRLSLYDANSRLYEVSDYYLLRDGTGSFELNPALNDPHGTWRIVVDDLIASRQKSVTFDVIKGE
ncbi:MAG: hypothetical protein L0228_01740 [Planctomycetes bacterium]|nr:hypothetical protein [Planctomycetota bacterium]